MSCLFSDVNLAGGDRFGRIRASVAVTRLILYVGDPLLIDASIEYAFASWILSNVEELSIADALIIKLGDLSVEY